VVRNSALTGARTVDKLSDDILAQKFVDQFLDLMDNEWPPSKQIVIIGTLESQRNKAFYTALAENNSSRSRTRSNQSVSPHTKGRQDLLHGLKEFRINFSSFADLIIDVIFPKASFRHIATFKIVEISLLDKLDKDFTFARGASLTYSARRACEKTLRSLKSAQAQWVSNRY